MRRAAALLIATILSGAAVPAGLPVTQGGLSETITLPLRSRLKTAGDWTAIGRQAPSEAARFGDVPAEICFRRHAGGSEACTVLVHAETNSADRLVYQTIADIGIARLADSPLPVEAVLVTAEAAYGGSGSLTQYSLWSYHGGGDFFATLATFQTTEQGEFRIVPAGRLAGTIIVADYIWGAGETHFSRHRYAIQVHRLDPVSQTYTEILRYVTRAKYPGLDEGGPDVINPETPQILRTLHFVYPDLY